MKKQSIALLCAMSAVALISIAAVSSGPKETGDTAAINELRTQIAGLQTRIQTLETQTQALQSTVEELKRAPSPTPLNLLENLQKTAPFSPSSPSPKIWGQKEVNGWTYYIVPCEQTGR